MSNDGGRRGLPTNIGAAAQLRDSAEIDLVLALQREDAPDVRAHFFKGGGTGICSGAQLGDVEAEGRGEDAGALARFEGPDGVFELLDHLACGELPEVASIAFAVGVAFGDFGEWLAALQLGQRRFDARPRPFRAMLPVDMLHDVRGVKRLRVAEVSRFAS